MHIFVISGKPRDGKAREAMEWAKAAAADVNKIDSSSTTRVYQQQFSDNKRIQWVAEYESLAAYEASEAKRLADKDHMEDVGKNVHVLFEDIATAIYKEAN